MTHDVEGVFEKIFVVRTNVESNAESLGGVYAANQANVHVSKPAIFLLEARLTYRLQLWLWRS